MVSTLLNSILVYFALVYINFCAFFLSINYMTSLPNDLRTQSTPIVHYLKIMK